MKIKVLAFLFCLLFVFNLTSCGFNSIMYRHLSNANNYKTYEVVIDYIFVYDKHPHCLEIYNEMAHDESVLSKDVSFGISSLDGFYYYEYTPNNGDDSIWTILLDVSDENSKILLENNFYKDYSIGQVVTIQCSNWTYMDTNYYYVIDVEYAGKQYLDSETGLQNVIAMMNKNRSLF